MIKKQSDTGSDNNLFKPLSSDPVSDFEKLEQEIIKSVEGTKNQKIIHLPKSNKLVLKALNENEFGDSYLLIKCLKNKYSYDHNTKDWYYFNEHFWRLDKLNHITTLIREVIDLYGQEQIYQNFALQTAKTEGDEKAEKTHKYHSELLRERINSLRTLNRTERVLKLAVSGLKSLGVTGESWDKKPWLLGVRNGVIDLKNGKFQPGLPSDYIRLVSPIRWEGEDASRDLWERFLFEMFSGDQEMIDFIQRLLGYGITGLTNEDVFPIFWGATGRNGKSTLTEILKYVLGELAFKIPSKYLMETNNNKDGTNPDAIMVGFKGKRIVWLSESNKKDRFDVAKLKELSGGDTMSARAPYAKRPDEIEQTQLIITILNKRPMVPHDDPALWRRILLIELKAQFVNNPDPKNPHEFKVNKKLKEQLKTQAPGILTWLVEGAILWQEYGLNPPDKVMVATKEYQESQDIFGHFLTEKCITGSPDYRITGKKTYETYKIWCDEVGHRPMAKNKVIEEMKNRFGETKRTNGFDYFRGIMDK